MMEARQLNTGYPAGPVLHAGLNFQIPAGQRLLIAGRNGIGKSTLIRTLAGLLPPISGELLIDSHSMKAMSIASISDFISIAFSTPPELPMMRSQDLLLTAIQKRLSPFDFKLERELEQARNYMSLCGVGHLYGREFSRLSDGEKQKLMLARCLMQQTPVILLDEPLAFLDYPSRIEFLDLLGKLCTDEGKCILFSSHDLELSLSHCEKLLLLQRNGSWEFTEDKEKIRSLKPALLFNDTQSIPV